MAIPKVSGLNCPNCGGPIELRSFTNAMTVVCPQCLSVLDAKDPNLQILQQASAQQRINPLIPLGTRGTLPSGIFEAIGFQVRTVYEDGQPFSWSEYLLYNPYKGFRYLTEYQGHWNDVRTLNTLPEPSGSSVKVAGAMFKIFSNATATTTYVLGEFPWQIRVGEQIQVTDYVSVPKVLSAETTPDEVVWSMGDYMTGEQVWQAFKLPTPPPPAYGVFENQPSPYNDSATSLWSTSLKLAFAALVIAGLISATGARKTVYRQTFSSASGVSPTFEVTGHTSNLQVKTINHTGQPLYVRYAFVNQTNGRNTNFGRQVRTDSAGDVATMPSVEPGRYNLRADAESLNGPLSGFFDVELRRDVPGFGWLFVALPFLLIPPIFQSFRKMSFERTRWAGSST